MATRVGASPRTDSAITSRVLTPRQGRRAARARPCTVLSPTRRPVNDPGPTVTA